MKMKQLYVFLAILVIPMLFSCTNIHKPSTPDKQMQVFVEEMLGSRVVLPDNMYSYFPYKKDNIIKYCTSNSESKYRIITYINASCATCIENLIAWKEIIPDFNNKSISVSIICDSKDEFKLLDYLIKDKKVITFPYNLLLDKDRKFLEYNSIMKKSDHLKTVLVDSNNKILLVGNPTYSEKIYEIYMDYISSLENN